MYLSIISSLLLYFAILSSSISMAPIGLVSSPRTPQEPWFLDPVDRFAILVSFTVDRAHRCFVTVLRPSIVHDDDYEDESGNEKHWGQKYIEPIQPRSDAFGS